MTSVKHRLLSGEKLNGCWISMFNAMASEIIALSGYDTVFIDLEHAPGSYIDAIHSIQAVKQHHCPALIRTSSSDVVEIKRTLDIGPDGIMVPNVRNRQEAEDVISACRYGPEGVRGAAPRIIRASGYGDDVDAYLEFMKNDFLLIAQIESKEAVDDFENIVNIEGIDMFFIGPSDLSASMGQLNDFTSQAFNDAYEHIVQVTLSAGKLLGSVPSPGRDSERLFNSGHHLVLSGTDSILLKSAAMEDVSRMHHVANNIKPDQS